MSLENLRYAANVNEILLEFGSFSLVKETDRHCSFRHKCSINHKAELLCLVDLHTTEDQFHTMCKIFDHGKSFGKTLGRRDAINSIRGKVHEIQRILGL